MEDQIENAIDDLKGYFDNLIENDLDQTCYMQLQSHLNYIGELADNLINEENDQ